MWRKLVDFLTAEWMVRNANGGPVVLGRALFISILIAGPTIGIREINLFGDSGIGERITDALKFLGVVFAASYTALYARFSQQWTYLANLYNQIKATEVRASTSGPMNEDASKRLAEWKAGFIEDADAVHLVKKRLFASVIVSWSRQEQVEASYCEHGNDGEHGWDRIVCAAKDTVARRSTVRR
ncbi:MAG: hypothetical protein WEB06_02070 [Actinomycetota bacterium]